MIKKSVIFIAFILCCVVCFFAGRCVGNRDNIIKGDTIIYTDTVFKTDTLKYDKPVPVDNFNIKVIHDTLPAVVSGDNSLIAGDSVVVEVPITAKVYEDSTYKAFLSGYRASLDSIWVFPTTKTITTVREVFKKPKRFSLGIQGGLGYGIISKKFEPYIGFGLSVRF